MKVIDMHCDTITELWGKQENGIQVGLRHNDQMIDIERLTKGGYVLQNFAIFVEQQSGVSSFEKAQQIRSVFAREMNQNADRIAMVTSVKGIEENEQAGKVSALLTVEGGEACEGSIEKLHVLYEQGVRMMTLTWNYPNEIGYPNLPIGAAGFPYVPDTEHGLTSFGIQCVEEMEKMGMIIDVSHLSDAGVDDVLRYTKKPFVASHSNARAICPWVRNLTDDMIREMVRRNCLIGLNYCKSFITDGGIGDSPDDLYRHIEHFFSLGAYENIALVSDFDGAALPTYLNTPAKAADLYEYFLEKGMAKELAEGIMFRNAEEFFRKNL